MLATPVLVETPRRWSRVGSLAGVRQSAWTKLRDIGSPGVVRIGQHVPLGGALDGLRDRVRSPVRQRVRLVETRNVVAALSTDAASLDRVQARGSTSGAERGPHAESWERRIMALLPSALAWLASIERWHG